MRAEVQANKEALLKELHEETAAIAAFLGVEIAKLTASCGPDGTSDLLGAESSFSGSAKRLALLGPKGLFLLEDMFRDAIMFLESVVADAQKRSVSESSIDSLKCTKELICDAFREDLVERRIDDCIRRAKELI